MGNKKSKFYKVSFDSPMIFIKSDKTILQMNEEITDPILNREARQRIKRLRKQ